jgi:hypothetical protein
LALDLGDDLLSVWEVATGEERRQYGMNSAPGERQPGSFGSYQTHGLPTRVRLAAGAAFSPDGRLLAQCLSDGTIRLWETTTAKDVGRLAGHPGGVRALAFAPNGQALTSGSRDTTALTWDLAAPRAGGKAVAAELSDAEAQAHWAALADDSAAQAFDAICGLALAPGRAVPFLRAHLKPVAPADAEKVRRLIADLDSDDFEQRERAGAELARLGESARAQVRKSLADRPSAEARKRLEELLTRTPKSLPTGEALRQARALEVLELIGTPEARQALEALAKGAGEARLTDEAAAALGRLKRRSAAEDLPQP